MSRLQRSRRFIHVKRQYTARAFSLGAWNHYVCWTRCPILIKGIHQPEILWVFWYSLNHTGFLRPIPMSILENLRNLNNVLAAFFFFFFYKLCNGDITTKRPFLCYNFFLLFGQHIHQYYLFILSRYHPITSKMLYFIWGHIYGLKPA